MRVLHGVRTVKCPADDLQHIIFIAEAVDTSHTARYRLFCLLIFCNQWDHRTSKHLLHQTFCSLFRSMLKFHGCPKFFLPSLFFGFFRCYPFFFLYPLLKFSFFFPTYRFFSILFQLDFFCDLFLRQKTNLTGNCNFLQF